MGNSMGGAPYGSCDAETTRGNPGKRKERYGSDDRVDGREIVENSMGRAPVGRSDTGMTTGVDGRETVGNKLGESSVGKERYGNDDGVDGRETVGNSSGRAPFKRSDTEAMIGWTEGKPWEIAWGELRRTEKQSCWHGFSGQMPSMRLSRKTVRPRLPKWVCKRWAMGHA